MTDYNDFVEQEIYPLLGEFRDQFDVRAIFEAVSDFDPVKGCVWRNLTSDELWGIIAANDLSQKLAPITANDVKRGFLVGKVRLEDDGEQCVFCSIGDDGLYFGGLTAEDKTTWQYVNDMDFDEIINDIVTELEGYRASFPDVWLYFRNVLSNE